MERKWCTIFKHVLAQYVQKPDYRSLDGEATQCSWQTLWLYVYFLPSPFSSFHWWCSFFFVDYKLCGNYSNIPLPPFRHPWKKSTLWTWQAPHSTAQYTQNTLVIFLTIHDLAFYDSLNLKQPVSQGKDWVVMLSTEYLLVNSHQSLIWVHQTSIYFATFQSRQTFFRQLCNSWIHNETMICQA